MKLNANSLGRQCICVVLLLQSAGSVAIAAESADQPITAASESNQPGAYDPRLPAPEFRSSAQIKSQLRHTFERDAATTHVERLRTGDSRWIDLQWQLHRIVQAGQSLPNLSEYGVEKKTDGTYVLDVANNPQWGLWYRALSDLEDPGLFERHAQRLLERGFRNSDLQILIDYVQHQSPRRTVLESERHLARSVRAHRFTSPRFVSAIPADDASYAYQFDRTREQAKQRWAAGLLSRFDRQRQRILMSYFNEISGVIVFVPDADLNRSVSQFVSTMTSGQLEERILQEQETQQ